MPRKLEAGRESEKTLEMKAAVIESGPRDLTGYEDTMESDEERNLYAETSKWPTADGTYEWEHERGFVLKRELEFEERFVLEEEEDFAKSFVLEEEEKIEKNFAVEKEDEF